MSLGSVALWTHRRLGLARGVPSRRVHVVPDGESDVNVKEHEHADAGLCSAEFGRPSSPKSAKGVGSRGASARVRGRSSSAHVLL